MRKYVIVGSYWMGTICAVLGLFARGLDVLGMNFIDFSTKGGGIGYHSLMDGTLFFYAISIATASYHRLLSEEPGELVTRRIRRSLQRTSNSNRLSET